MAESDTLLANVLPGFTDRIEDFAVEALGYILNKSASSMAVLNSLVRADGSAMPEVVRVGTQVSGEERTRLDLTGFDQGGNERLLIEAKFWAGLTDNQPNAYLGRLPDDGPAVLLFVAPDARVETLWAELRRRVGENLGPDVGIGRVHNAILSGTDKRLLLVSWLHLLDSMATRAVGELDVQADIQQLRGLAQRMDAQAFLPLHPEELSSNIARRIGQFSDIFVAAIDRGRDVGVISRMSPVSSGWNYSGRYLNFAGVSAWFGVHSGRWSEGGSDDTPMWLLLNGASPDLLNKISVQLGLRASGNYFPIRLKTGVEWDDMLDNVVSQLQAIAEVLQAANSET